MLLFCILGQPPAFAQFIDTTDERVKTPLNISWKRIGTLKPRSTKEITASRITVGCETLDRDFTNFDTYEAYLPPLGVKKIRLQAGWAKCEKVKGQYDWKWLDRQVPTNSFETQPVDVTVPNGQFTTPVWVDLLTGRIHEIPRNQWSKTGTSFTFKNIPVYDSPVLLAEKDLVMKPSGR